MKFDFKLSPQVEKMVKEETEKAVLKEKEENNRIAELEQKKALQASMQSNVLMQLASKQPRNPASAPVTPSVDYKKGW